MGDFIISCCSTADLSKEHFKSRNIHYICFHYYLNGKHYFDDLGESMPFDKFYQAMIDGADTKTSQINVEEFINYFDSFLQQGKDILHVCLSFGISGTYNSANLAKNILEEKYPCRKIYIIDSLNASSGYGLLMDKLADLRDEGKTIDEIHEWVLANRYKCHAWFFSTDLTFFIKGGRVSKTAGYVGGMLNICPLLRIDTLGKLLSHQKVRTKKKAIKTIVEQMETYAENGHDYNGKCFISQSACYDDAKAVANLIEERFPKLNGKVLINNIGTTIGSHTGPGTVALFFWGEERTE